MSIPLAWCLLTTIAILVPPSLRVSSPRSSLLRFRIHAQAMRISPSSLILDTQLARARPPPIFIQSAAHFTARSYSHSLLHRVHYRSSAASRLTCPGSVSPVVTSSTTVHRSPFREPASQPARVVLATITNNAHADATSTLTNTLRLESGTGTNGPCVVSWCKCMLSRLSALVCTTGLHCFFFVITDPTDYYC